MSALRVSHSVSLPGLPRQPSIPETAPLEPIDRSYPVQRIVGEGDGLPAARLARQHIVVGVVGECLGATERVAVSN